MSDLQPYLPETEAMRMKIQDLRQRVEQTYLEMGGLLRRVYDGCLFKEWGYENFRSYIEAELGYKERKAYYLMEVQKTLQETLHLAPETIAKVEWTKARMLVPLVEKSGVGASEMETWIEDATHISAKQLQAKVQDRIYPGGKPTQAGAAEESVEKEVLTVFRAGLFAGQMKTVEAALEKAKGMADSDKTGYLLECICTAFLADGTNKNALLSRIFHSIQTAYGVYLIALDKSKTRIIFGGETMDELASKEDPS